MPRFSRKFSFGQNWKNYLRAYTPQRQQIAKSTLLSFLQTEDLKGKTFLDIGSGSGINSAAAWLAGASQVHSFDYDPNSVVATRQMHKNHGSPQNWTIEYGSVLDADFMRSLGKFDVVYSWGVLHHTGNQWLGFRNAALCMHDHSLLYIALYAKEIYTNWQYWIEVKQRYNKANWIKKHFIETIYIRDTYLDKKWVKLPALPKIMSQYQRSRGMDLVTDARDWLGGWPTEFSSVSEVVGFTERELGLVLVNLLTGEGNSEFLFARKGQPEKLGYKPFDLLLELDDTCELPPQPAWIFGALRGGEIIFDYLAKRKVTVAGFIELEPTAASLHERPVMTLANFILSQPTSTPVILANRYVKENSARLRKAGFNTLFNGHPLILRLHNG